MRMPNTNGNDRDESLNYLLTLASRFNQEDHPKGKPRGFVIIVSEGNGDYTHHIANPEDEVEWMPLVGNMEVLKHAIITTNMSWAPVHNDGKDYDEAELAEFMEELDEEQEGE